MPAHRLGTQGSSSACMSHKAEAASVGSVPLPPWSALVVLVLNKSMVCQSQGGKQKDWACLPALL